MERDERYEDRAAWPFILPFVLVYGDRESEQALAVRERGGEQSTLSLDELLGRFRALAAEADPR